MSVNQWLLFILIIQVVHFLGTWKLYIKAGRKSWEAAIPVYNAIVLMKIINRPTWWTVLLFIPVINLILFPVVWVETLRSFGKNSTQDTLLGIVTFGLSIFLLNYSKDIQYIQDRSTVATTKTGDTISSILFAIVVATLVHTYAIQPFQIPTSSLEKSLLVGDFLFVSKVNYGARTPMTPIAAPMVHDTMPLINKKSYLAKPQLPYFRFPGFERIKNNDIVVFNWPTDTLFNMYLPTDKRYDKPIDKKTNYVKRCVGIPGDNLQIKDGIVYINGKELILPERAKPQYFHTVTTKVPLNQELLDRNEVTEFSSFYKIKADFWDNGAVQKYLFENRANLNEVSRDSSMVLVTGSIKQDDAVKFQMEGVATMMNMNLTLDKVATMKKDPEVASITRYISKGGEDGIFPDHKDGTIAKDFTWNNDNFGPLYIPKRGAKVSLDLKSLAVYKKIITEYEGNTLQVKGSTIFINGLPTNSYTFQKDYYWMMGDNRHNSLDARYFGFTPDDHIVGKPIFIWMSWDTNGKGLNKIRWDRLFTTVSGEGQPQSYFKLFILFLVVYHVGMYFWNKKKEKNS
ncbi:MAG: signal peptidase I [Flavobacterium sp.]|nr:signal peptidase I [Flavobacterium sp.]MBP6100039.1 signal peptidase I [Flavobacterium sp.]